MYRMGTGDCFAIKFFAGKKISFKMLIDAGTWQGSKEHLDPYIKNLKEYIDDFVDVLVVTHEQRTMYLLSMQARIYSPMEISRWGRSGWHGQRMIKLKK